MALFACLQWVKWTYKQYLHDVQVCAKAFIRLGLERFHSVCILGFNSPEWFIADLAAIHAGYVFFRRPIVFSLLPLFFS